MSPIFFLSPLESTWPSWQEYQVPSNMFMFLLCLGVPLLVGLVITGLVLGAGRGKEEERQRRILAMNEEHRQRTLAAAPAPARARHALDADDEVHGSGAHVAARGV